MTSDKSVHELYGVGLFDNRPSTDYLHNFVKKNERLKLMTKLSDTLYICDL